MIHIPLNKKLLEKQKIFARADGALMKKLEEFQTEFSDNISQNILVFVIGKLEDIVSCDLEGLKRLQQEYVKYVFDLNILSNTSYIQDFRQIHEALETAFVAAYDLFTSRGKDSWNSYHYLKELNQIVCPYCNANFIQTLQATKVLKGAASRAMADLDHFLPKSIFPIFAITLSNLVPSCMYCNQRFKSNHYTNFQNYFSPFDEELQNSMTFKIHYAEDDFESVFSKLETLCDEGLSEEDQYYLELLSINILDKKVFDKHKEIYESFQEKIETLNREVVQLPQHANCQPELIELLDRIVLKAIDYEDVFHQFMTIEHSVKPFNYFEFLAGELAEICEQFIELRKEYESFLGIKKRRQVRKAVTAIKDELEKHEKLLRANFHITDTSATCIKGIDFVDVVLGNSTDYQIEIVANSDDIDVKRRVYHNAALFQLETVYRSFRPYINRKIRQSHIVNDLYKEQLVQQFPSLLTEQYMNTMVDVMIIDEASRRYEVLGKLTYDVILPAIHFRTNLRLG